MEDILSYVISLKSYRNMVKWKFENSPPPRIIPPEEFCDFLGYLGVNAVLISALERERRWRTQ